MIFPGGKNGISFLQDGFDLVRHVFVIHDRWCDCDAGGNPIDRRHHDYGLSNGLDGPIACDLAYFLSAGMADRRDFERVESGKRVRSNYSPTCLATPAPGRFRGEKKKGFIRVSLTHQARDQVALGQGWRQDTVRAAPRWPHPQRALRSNEPYYLTIRNSGGGYSGNLRKTQNL